MAPREIGVDERTDIGRTDDLKRSLLPPRRNLPCRRQIQSNPIQCDMAGAGGASLPASKTTIYCIQSYRLVDHRFQLSRSHRK